MNSPANNNNGKERSRSSNGISTSSSQSHQQQQPPSMIAEFPDYYVRNDDIIRPKPRRLVDMRRSAVGPGMEFSLSADFPNHTPTSGPLNSSSSSHNPPSLPARSSLTSPTHSGKPLPPKPSSTNILGSHNPSMISPTKIQHQLPVINSENYLQYAPFYSHNAAANRPTQTAINQQQQQKLHPGKTSTPITFNGQRSVPSLPQLLQYDRQANYPQQQQQQHQQRLFLSPPPHMQQQQFHFSNNGNRMAQLGPHSGSTSNLSSSNCSSPNINNNNGINNNRFYSNNSNNHNYSDLNPNTMNNSSQQYSRPVVTQRSSDNNSTNNPRVRGVVEWKSVDNLQLVQQNNSNNTPKTHIIDFGEPIIDNNEEKVKPPPTKSVVKNLSLAFEMSKNNQRQHLAIPNNYEIPKPALNHRMEVKEDFNDDSESLSPLYDRIRSPPMRVNQDKETAHPLLSPPLGNNHQPLLKVIGKVAESTDGSSLGRSSTSDYDFSSSHGSTCTVKATSTIAEPSVDAQNIMADNQSSGILIPRKSKNSAPSSKLKSKSRRNILQHLTIDEIKELKNGTNNPLSVTKTSANAPTAIITNEKKTANNTGTGGSSSSDGSSGHASMTDSLTSGSPPAPAEYGKLTASGSGDALLSPCLNNFKTVLKSVPEDEQQQTTNVLNSSVGSGNSAHNNSRFDKNDVRNHSGSHSSNSSGRRKSSSSAKSRHRNSNNKQDSILLGNGLEDIKQAIEQLTLKSSTTNSTTTILDKNASSIFHNNGGGGGGRFLGPSSSDHHSSYSTSTYSSMSGSECDRHRRPPNQHNNSNSTNNGHGSNNTSNNLIRHSSLETINTQVTSADEFVWVDSHNRLVELQQFPWSNVDILKVIEKSSKLRDSLERISMETVPRVSYLLQRALVRIAREIQRLAKTLGFCSKHEVTSAFRIVLAPGLADSCVKACLRAAAMYSVSTNDSVHRQSKSGRAGLHLHVGRFQRWMNEVRLGRFVHEFAAIHFTAGMENLIEEIFAQSLAFTSSSDTIEKHFNSTSANTSSNTQNLSSTGSSQKILTAALLEQAISFNADLWGLLQPFSHLNAGRMASGALAIPRWSSVVSVDSSGSSSTTIGGTHDDLSHRLHQHNKSLEQSLLTTCVGSVGELSDILSKVTSYHHKQVPHITSNGTKSQSPSWSPSAIHTLFYFMRCSQLEAADELANLNASTATLRSDNVDRSHHNLQNRIPVQELVYERPFIVLPPLIEWVRVATAHSDHRHSGVIDKDDILQAARLLLPGIDCPIRLVGTDEFSWARRQIDEFECNRRLKVDLAFKMLASGRSDLVAQALLLMPPTKANTFNEQGLSPLILASIRGEEIMVRVLLDTGADVDLETPANGQKFPQANSETQSWTALTFAALMGHANIVKILLERGANVEGGAKLSEEKPTQTPLQVAVATGHLEIVTSLLNYGANPFHSTLVRDSLCYIGSAQRGSFSAISVATSHGQRTILHKLLSHPLNSTQAAKEVLSLEEILAEGIQHQQQQKFSSSDSSTKHLLHYGRSIEETPPNALTKSQMKVLQEAMYQSAENGYLELTLDLRNMGVSWSLHCWINTLETAHDLRCEAIVDQLLQDFLQILPNEDFSQSHFVDECLPLLLTIFRNGKIEGTTLLLADIFQTCYGKDPIKEIHVTCISNNGTRIDPKYVNNPELSDVQFRVEGKIFYAHKIVLVTSSARFKSMLKGVPEANPPLLQINDIRYPIFKIVMEYLYNGGCDTIKNTIENDDVLELMAAANFFQLDGLLRFCESKCSQMVNVESVVSLYIHAKVYNAAQLLEYCQGFLLQNMVAILTYDDSVRRLIFGKKLHNHDVLAGLLLTLQDRLKFNKSNSSRNLLSNANNSGNRKSK